MNAQRHRWNRRKAMAVLLAVSVILLAAIAIAGQVLKEGHWPRISPERICRPAWPIPLERTGWDGICSSAALQAYPSAYASGF